jgi:polysaccharide export outer membrane protein
MTHSKRLSCAGPLLAFCLGLILLSGGLAALCGQNPSEDPDNGNYRLGKLDQIQITIFDEPDLSVAQRISGEGSVRIPLIGVIKVAGLTISKAEAAIEQSYIENEILKDPIVSIRVIEYAPKEISILGAVGAPGKLPFPTEVSSLDIVDVISKVGGFTQIARADSVRITRIGDDGREIIFTVNVESMITGRGRRSGEPARVPVYPGDVIWVPERMF